VLTKKRQRQPATEAPVVPVIPEQAGPPDRVRLGELLVKQRRITAAQLSEALVQQSASGTRVGTLLVELGALDERELAAVLAEQLDLAVVDLRAEAPDPDVVALVPESLARGGLCVPMWYAEDESLVVAAADPSPTLRAELQKVVGGQVTLVVAPAGDIRRVIDSSYRALAGIDDFVSAFTATTPEKRAAVLTTESTADDAPVVQIVNKIISQALRDRASDIHIEPQDRRLRIRFRIDGALHDVLALPEAMGAALTSRLKIMGGMNIVERRRPQDGQIEMDVDGRSVDIRDAGRLSKLFAFSVVTTRLASWPNACGVKILADSTISACSV
jgi:type IV pilus assembly protein PilB